MLRALSVALLSLLSLHSLSAQSAPQVVTTIKPLQLIAEAVTAGVTQPRQLLAAGTSPHDYQLRPSDLKQLNEADLLLWIGPAMAPFLHKPVQQLPQTRVVQLLQTTKQEHGRGHDHDHGHDHAAGDPHIWLDPVQGIAIATRLSEALVELDPSNRPRYEANLGAFVDRVKTLDRALAQRLAPLKAGYFVFHDAYGHFERHYGLNHLGAFTLSPQRPPGARQLQHIRRQLETSQARCIFSEPQFRSDLVERVAEGLPVKRGSLDPLATDADSYTAFLEQLAGEFARCLQQAD
ncbi:zinc ABC transporter substrate-binding protein ZnuA [Motiliproteus sp. SC1-56]|uniref:zinc ABC transporter substrate-binding protein ZnuA n=1 Tax=Motiliproteus sp. SC1-56 TaxID=2799565 RepID=UPI001A8E626A|nr:zinc ABC transporter substrate-binding protein ZnuA [Motiliproteus sp. SC1-56]